MNWNVAAGMAIAIVSVALWAKSASTRRNERRATKKFDAVVARERREQLESSEKERHKR